MSFVLDRKADLVLNILRVVCKDHPAETAPQKANVDRIKSRLGKFEIDSNNSQNAALLNEAAEMFCKENPACEFCPINKFCAHFVSKSQKNYLEEIKHGITFVDLFCGVGGASLGFEQAGLLPVYALDYEKNAISTYRFNRPYMSDDMVVNDNAEHILAEGHIHSAITGAASHPDIVFGGVPCQGFSNANRQRLIEDPRNKLYKYFVNAVRYLQPKVLVMENVVGIRKIASQITEDFDHIGYHVDYRVFDARDFGLPQYRKRVIFIGIPKRDMLFDKTTLECLFSGVEAKQMQTNTVLRSAIYDLRPLSPSRKRNNPDHEDAATGYKIDTPLVTAPNAYLSEINRGIKHRVIYNHKSRFNNERDIEIFRKLPQGENSLHEAIKDIMPYKDRNGIFKDKYYKLRENEPCKTITAHMKFDCNMYIHPTQPRGLTVREAARIQSFPDDYIITGTFQKLYEQVGNAVPPMMAKTIAEVVKEYIEELRSMSHVAIG